MPTRGTCSTPGATAARSTRSRSTSRRRSPTRWCSRTSTASCGASCSCARRTDVRLTRRDVVGGAAAGALGAAGLYELVDRIAGAPTRAEAASRSAEQHLLGGQRIVEDDGIEILVPPLHHQVVTARVAVAEKRSDLRAAQRELEQALASLDQRFEAT